MADLNPYMGASGVVVNLEGLRRDMRANAFEYLARALDQQPIDIIAQVIAGNAAGYLMRITQWYQTDRADPTLSLLMAQGLAVDASVPLTKQVLTLDTSGAVPVAQAPDITGMLSKYDALAAQCLTVAQAEKAATAGNVDILSKGLASVQTYTDVIAVANATLATVPLVM